MHNYLLTRFILKSKILNLVKTLKIKKKVKNVYNCNTLLTK